MLSLGANWFIYIFSVSWRVASWDNRRRKRIFFNFRAGKDDYDHFQGVRHAPPPRTYVICTYIYTDQVFWVLTTVES